MMERALLGQGLGRKRMSAAQKKVQIVSEIRRSTNDVWEDIYAKYLIDDDDVPEDLKKRFLAHRQQERKIFSGMSGEWWRRGLLMRIRHALDGYYDKVNYELGQEAKVIHILQSDLSALRDARMPPCAHRRRVFGRDKGTDYKCTYREWNGACRHDQAWSDCWMCAFFTGGFGSRPKHCAVESPCPAAASEDVELFRNCRSFVSVQVLENSRGVDFGLITQRNQRPGLRPST